MANTDIEVAEVSQAVQEKRGWFIALGIVMIVVGSAAIIFPYVATVSTKIFLGWFLIIGGIVQAIHAFWVKDWGGFFWQLIVGLLEVFAGLFLLVYPVAGIIALTIYVAAVFIVEGIIKAFLAFQLKPEAGWIWVLIGGIVSILLGAMLWAKLPSSAIWAIGLLVGVNIAMAGWTLLMLAMAAGSLEGAKAKAKA
jgi:uncharacterized membrane protein HdeD (DUF308 family)